LAALQLMNDAIDRLMENLVHPALRREPDIFYRARVLVGLILVTNAIAGISGVVTVFGYQSLQTRLMGAAICLALIAGNGLVLYILRSRGNFTLCCLAETLLVAVGVVGGIVLSGGILRSPETQILVVPPLMVYFFAGRRSGTYALLWTLLLTLLLFMAEQMQIIVPVNIAANDIELSRVLSTFMGVAAVSTMALIFELNSSKLKRERDAVHQKMLALAQTDVLTGLANRRSVDAQLTARIDSESPVRDFALCFIDLDGFKTVNDRFGHAVGDEVLRAVAGRLRQSARDQDVVGRLGGDEFTVIFDTPINVVAIQDRMLAVIALPIDTRAGQLIVGASGGLAFYPQHGATAETLKKAADKAMYTAKQRRNKGRAHDLDRDGGGGAQ